MSEEEIRKIVDDQIVQTFSRIYDNTIPPACRGCSNHPNNGGSGICHCINGSMTISC